MALLREQRGVMVAERLEMRNVREIMRLKSSARPAHKEIGRSLGVAAFLLPFDGHSLG
jgi:hypothetical protein